MNNQEKLTEKNLKDIEEALLHKISPIKPSGKDKSIDFNVSFISTKKETFASVSWIDNNELHTKSGMSRKRKGDVYNKKTGQLLALIDML